MSIVVSVPTAGLQFSAVCNTRDKSERLCLVPEQQRGFSPLLWAVGFSHLDFRIWGNFLIFNTFSHEKKYWLLSNTFSESSEIIMCFSFILWIQNISILTLNFMLNHPVLVQHKVDFTWPSSIIPLMYCWVCFASDFISDMDLRFSCNAFSLTVVYE